MIIISAYLAMLGLVFGSFVNALVDRIHAKQSWVKGRSHCDHCNHVLGPLDLIPLISWLSLGGKCRYCKKPISSHNPLIELATGLWFVLSYVFWPYDLNTSASLVFFICWLAASVGLMALLAYDALWMLLPNKLIYPTLALASIGRVVYIFLSPNIAHDFLSWGFAVMIASGLFYALFYISKGKWIGFGDVRLGLILGTLLGTPSLSIFMIFTASVLGTIAAIPGIILGNKNLSSRIPFGPFLIMATLLSMIAGTSIINWYNSSILH